MYGTPVIEQMQPKTSPSRTPDEFSHATKQKAEFFEDAPTDIADSEMHKRSISHPKNI